MYRWDLCSLSHFFVLKIKHFKRNHVGLTRHPIHYFLRVIFAISAVFVLPLEHTDSAYIILMTNLKTYHAGCRHYCDSQQ